jgi:cell wall-associated NlpC family hydrolase
VMTAARQMLDAGQVGALIGAASEVSRLAGQFDGQASTAHRTARQALEAAVRQLAELTHEIAPAHKKHHAPHPTATLASAHKHGHKHHPGSTVVNIGHGLGQVTAPNAAAATAVRTALSQLGVPYVWGGESPGHAFDCSGLTKYAYSKAGIDLPHFASDQRVGKRVTESQLQPGDLVIFSGHVTMYLGNGHVIAAPHTGTVVQIEPLFTYIPGDPFLGFWRPTE